jgi:hypothetical protein
MKFKTDKYKHARGGYSRFVNVHCRKCEHIVLVYQKDGPGVLRRLYLDRIVEPENMQDVNHLDISEMNDLRCQNCDEYLGTPYIYKKENRKAIRLYVDAVVKRLRKAK